MRPRTTVYIATTLDGFIARPDGSLDWLDHDSGGEDYGWEAFFSSVDAMVMGRGTFEAVRDMDVPWPYGDTPVVVLSRTLTGDDLAGLDVGLWSDSPRALLAGLAARGVEHVYVDGGGTVQSFLREGLVDRLIVTRMPVLLGTGIPLFGALDGDVPLRHVETRAWDSGVVQSTYEVQR